MLVFGALGFAGCGSLRVRLATKGSSLLVGRGEDGVVIIWGGGVGSGTGFSGLGAASSPSSSEDMLTAVGHCADVLRSNGPALLEEDNENADTSERDRKSVV